MKRLFGLLGVLLVLSLGFAVVVHAEEDYKKFGVRVRAIYVKPASPLTAA